MADSTPTLMVVFEFNTINGGENSILAALPLIQASGWRIEAAVPLTLAALQQTKHQPASNRKTLIDQLEQRDIDRHPLPTHHADGTRKTQAQYRADCAQLLQQRQPDVVLCNSLSTSRLCGPVTAATNRPAAGYLRDIIKLSAKAVDDINQLDRIIAVSNATMNFHVEQKMDPEKVRVVYNGVDLDVFGPHQRTPEIHQRVRQSLHIPQDAQIVLFVGQIGMRKGVDVLLESFAQLTTAVPNCHLLVVGQRHSQKEEAKEYEAQLYQRANQAPLREKVHWLGRRDDVHQLMGAADLLLHPARQEPLGRVILEAIASGLPVVTTLVGGSPEILGCVDSFDLMCNVDDAAQMAGRAEAMLQDPALWKKTSIELSNLAIRRFNRKQSAQSLMWHLNSLRSSQNSSS